MNRQHILLLVGKNWRYRIRQRNWIFAEVLLPTAIAFICALMRVEFPVKSVDKPTFFRPMYMSSIYYSKPLYSYYTPRTPSTDELFRTVLNISKGAYIDNTDSRCTRIDDYADNKTRKFSVLGCNTEADAMSYAYEVYKNFSHGYGFLYALSGRSKPIQPGSHNLPSKLNVKFRPMMKLPKFLTAQIYPKKLPTFPECDGTPDKISNISKMMEFYEGVAKYWLAKKGETLDKAKWKLGSACMPWPPHKRDKDGASSYLAWAVFWAFILFGVRFTTILIREKASKIKEVLLMVGVSPSSYWTSWFVTAQVYHLLPMFVIFTLIVQTSFNGLSGPVLGTASPSLFFVTLCIYGFAFTSFCFMVSSLVQSEILGVLLCLVLLVLSQKTLDYESSRSKKLASCLGFNNAMILGLQSMTSKSGTLGKGMHWGNMHEPAVNDDISLLECLLFLLLDAFLYALIAWYIDQIMPTSIGVSKHPLFFLTKRYWSPEESGKLEGVQEMSVAHDPRFFETSAKNKKAGIQIRNLRKVFGAKAVVNGTNLDMYEDEIMVLLGHNGAGKTVTMSMLTGFINPTSGTAIVNGYDIRKDLDQARKYVGVCPQFNILFPYLTVMEHLMLFSAIKGQSGAERMRECDNLCQASGLNYKRGALSDTLSGGQKRMLSVALSLVGGTKIVILDEPSAGMDVAIRRQTWDLLKSTKQGRTMLLTTHYMDEADALGDRIAIMSEGKVKCCGNSLFLKKLYGSGYHLVLSTRKGCSADTILEQIQMKIPEAKLERAVMNEISIELPMKASYKFQKLFDQLEKDKDQLKIGSFGIGTTSMEEVFLRSATSEPVGLRDKPSSMTTVPESESELHSASVTSPTSSVSDRKDNLESKASQDSNANALKDGGQVLKIDSEPEQELLHGCSYAMHALCALLTKRFIQAIRDVWLPLLMIIPPCVIAFIQLRKREPFAVQVEPNLLLDVSMFGDIYLPYGVGQSKQPSPKEFGQEYAALFKDKIDVTLDKISVSKQSPFDEHLMSKINTLGLDKAMVEMPIGMMVLKNSSSPSKIPVQQLDVVAYHSTGPTHGQTVSMIYTLRALLKQTLNDSFDIQSSLHPMDILLADTTGMIKQAVAQIGGMIHGMTMIFIVPLVGLYPAQLIIQERTMGTKHLQIVSGAGPLGYWCSNFIFDFSIYLISILLTLPAFYLSGDDVWVADDGELGIMFLGLALYGFVIHWLFYSVGFFFDKSSSAIIAQLVSLIGSIVLMFIYAFASVILAALGSTLHKKLDYLCSAFLPAYNLMRITSALRNNYDQEKECLQINCTGVDFHACCPGKCYMFCAGSDDHMPFVIALLLQGIVLVTFVFLMDYHILSRVMYLVRGDNNSELYYSEGDKEDVDVAAERKRMEEKSEESLTSRGPECDTVSVVNIVKAYGYHVAVNNLSMGIPKGECFGLLGQNGAGKTTTFKMMSGEVLVGSGKAYVMGYDVTRQADNVQMNIGYCPQFDGLFLNLTARQVLTLIARLRGFPTKAIPNLINELTTILTIQDFVDIQAGLYSGGTKRKLNVAQTLVGRPPVLFLDEPSWGMDPEARRHMWDVLGRYRDEGTTLVLTSHSMEECEALCTRLGIMVNGKFKCIGSSQHLKSRFGYGYSFVIQMTASDGQSEAPTEPVVAHIEANLPGSQVFDTHQNYIHFQAPDSCTLGGIFKVLESLKGTLNVSDYSVQQTSLEQVFLSFAMEQKPPTFAPPWECKCCCCCKIGC